MIAEHNHLIENLSAILHCIENRWHQIIVELLVVDTRELSVRNRKFALCSRIFIVLPEVLYFSIFSSNAIFSLLYNMYCKNKKII